MFYHGRTIIGSAAAVEKSDTLSGFVRNFDPTEIEETRGPAITSVSRNLASIFLMNGNRRALIPAAEKVIHAPEAEVMALGCPRC